MNLDATSRILIFAPHPDDEALATGGLLQRAVASRAVVRIIFATAGDNNPWPHRVLERRWKIEPHHRMLWAARRADEALASLETLGISSGCVEFLGLPDQHITDLLLRERGKVVTQLARIFEHVRPNLVVAPAPFDLHPDHSALHLLVGSALACCGPEEPGQLYYAVHTRGYHSDWTRCAIELTRREQETKKRAILCHRTQVALSRRRFLNHAKPAEEYWMCAASREIDSRHPVRGGRVGTHRLVLQLQRDKGWGSFERCILLLATDHGEGIAEIWSLQLRGSTGKVRIVDEATGVRVGLAELQIHGAHAQIVIPLQAAARRARFFVKLKEPTLFFDAAGWREIPARTAKATHVFRREKQPTPENAATE